MMAATRTPATTPAERRKRYLAVNARYNQSEKGRARKRAYRESVAEAARSSAPAETKSGLERLAEMCE